MKFEKSFWGLFVFVFKSFLKTVVFIQITFFILQENIFLQKFSLKLFDVEPSRTLNGAFCFSFPNTVNPVK